MSPDAPKAHEKDPAALLFRPLVWNKPTSARPFRTCSYCGSVHPQDLLQMLREGDSLSLADMKDGWPHKFYTEDYNKFYSLHMLDAGESFELLSAAIKELTLVEFIMTPEGIHYRIPRKKEL